MTKTIKYLVLFASCIQLYTACQPEEISMPDMGRKIVINGLMTTDSLLSVYVDKSGYVSDTDYVFRTDLDNAKVYIYENSICIDSLSHPYSHYLGNRIYGLGNYWSKKVKPMPGKEYKILAKVPGLPDATAITRIPSLVRIEKVDTLSFDLVTHSQGGVTGNYKFMKCNVVFTDPGNETNYYLFNVCVDPGVEVIGGYRYSEFLSSDPVIEERLTYRSNMSFDFTEGIIFSDKIINGKKYSLSVEIPNDWTWRINNPQNPFSHDKITVYFRLYSIPEAYFMYIQTMNLYYAKFGKPLSEPVQVFSNITGGYGIFAGAAVSADSIIFRR